MANTVIGIFDSKDNAIEARRQLISNGFSEDSIDLSSQGHFNMEGKYAEENMEGRSANEHESGIGHFFKSLFGDSDEAQNYSEVARRGTVVTVHTDTLESAELAADILDQYGAINANERAYQYRTKSMADTTGMGEDVRYRSSGEGEGISGIKEDFDETIRNQKDNVDELETPEIEAGTETSIPVIEEELEVGKRVVETGGVRVRSRIIERPVEEHLRLREEHVSVERTPVNRKATASDLENFKEGTIETTENAEVPVVGKQARVVEEVKIKKEVKERDETIRGSVKRQDVNVEKKKKKKETTGSDDEPVV
jgi:stress response protein YsnF